MIKQVLKNTALSVLPASVLCALKKLHYSNTLRSITEDCEVDLKVIRHLVRLNETTVDIGANIGVYTKFLSQFVGNQGKVISIEPVPLTYELLSHNVNALRLNNVTLFNCAISDKDETVTMKVPKYESGGENFYEAQIIQDGGDLPGSIKAQARTIDSLLSEDKEISFVKCDVEGHELSCIEGAANTIIKHKPAWCIEISTDPGMPETSAYKIFQILKRAGYHPYYFDGRILRAWHIGVRTVNHFFLTSEHLDLLKNKDLMEENSK